MYTQILIITLADCFATRERSEQNISYKSGSV